MVREVMTTPLDEFFSKLLLDNEQSSVSSQGSRSSSSSFAESSFPSRQSCFLMTDPHGGHPSPKMKSKKQRYQQRSREFDKKRVPSPPLPMRSPRRRSSADGKHARGRWHQVVDHKDRAIAVPKRSHSPSSIITGREEVRGGPAIAKLHTGTEQKHRIDEVEIGCN